MKPQPRTSTPAGLPFAHAMAKLEGSIASIKKELEDDIIPAQLALETDGIAPKFIAASTEDLEEAAMSLLNGSASALQERTTKRKRRYGEIIQRKAVLKTALEIANRLHEQLRLKARTELGEQRAGEYAAALKQFGLSLLAYEHCAQALEAVCAGTLLEMYHIHPLGALRIGRQ